jgi:hypothetical protein
VHGPTCIFFKANLTPFSLQGVNPRRREQYVLEKDFENVFNTTRELRAAVPRDSGAQKLFLGPKNKLILSIPIWSSEYFLDSG